MRGPGASQEAQDGSGSCQLQGQRGARAPGGGGSGGPGGGGRDERSAQSLCFPRRTLSRGRGPRAQEPCAPRGATREAGASPSARQPRRLEEAPGPASPRPPGPSRLSPILQPPICAPGPARSRRPPGQAGPAPGPRHSAGGSFGSGGTAAAPGGSRVMSTQLFQGQEHATIYQKHRFPPSQELLDIIFSYLEEKKGKPYDLVVDVGCGSGQSTQVLVPHFARVLGTDISEAQVQQARQAHSSSKVSFW
uniref:Methyltransferase domain-containing protein n=2 Tax=Sarcophilus harrisii TaxID=9305 RepID=A0A7N4PPS8_SARHA